MMTMAIKLFMVQTVPAMFMPQASTSKTGESRKMGKKTVAEIEISIVLLKPSVPLYAALVTK